MPTLQSAVPSRHSERQIKVRRHRKQYRDVFARRDFIASFRTSRYEDVVADLEEQARAAAGASIRSPSGRCLRGLVLARQVSAGLAPPTPQLKISTRKKH